jgi:hypothetical protein
MTVAAPDALSTGNAAVASYARQHSRPMSRNRAGGYRSPKNERTASTITTAPTIQMMLFMAISLRPR